MNCKNKFLALLLVGVLALPMFAEEAETTKSKWLDEYPKHIGFTWGADEELTANYIWRGLRVAGLSSFTDLSVGYGGLYFDMWWSLGAQDWAFNRGSALANFRPEVDLTLGFSRWGLNIMYMQMFYFDTYIGDGTPSRFFDYGNHGYFQGGITQEWRVKYKVSSKLPLTFLICARTFGRDGYYEMKDEYKTDANVAEQIIGEKAYFGVDDIRSGEKLDPSERDHYELKRAYSTYFEIGYDFTLAKNWTLTAQVGMTPWRSVYTLFQGGFAINNVNIRAVRTWEWGKHCDMRGYLQCMVNPWQLATNGVTQDGLMLNAGIGVSFK